MLWAASVALTAAAATDEAWAASQTKTAIHTAAKLPRRSCVRARLAFQRIPCVVGMGVIARPDHIV